MGGAPLTALAIAGFPEGRSTATVLGEIFRGGLDKLREAGVALLGGHTVQDQEIKFGYAVTGEVDPARIWPNAGARAGDVLILTKPLGTGVIATAIKFDRAPEAAVDGGDRVDGAAEPRRREALAALPPGTVHACTDVTGFGLVGHATEMAHGSGVTLEIDAGRGAAARGRARRWSTATRPAAAGPTRSTSAPGVAVAAGHRRAARPAALRPADLGRAAGRGRAGSRRGRRWRRWRRPAWQLMWSAASTAPEVSPSTSVQTTLESAGALLWPAPNGINLRLACSEFPRPAGRFRQHVSIRALSSR